ncbi:MAG: ATPase, T2SS/T4P/T4SS family [bacterium]|nr:ATPase, T2SS/T4P/T4SS family [bacterium]
MASRDSQNRETTRRRLESQVSEGLAHLIAALDSESAGDVIANGDGNHVLIRGTGWRRFGERSSDASRERTLKSIASLLGESLTQEEPALAGKIEHLGIRVQGAIPPLSPSPEIALRRPPEKVFSLDDFDCRGFEDALRSALLHRKNILIVGSTGSGKTRFAEVQINILGEYFPEAHLLLLEDASEIRSRFALTSARRVVPPSTLRALVFQGMRLNPTFIVIGEVRGPEAYDLLKAWSTGHPGGVTTIHASSARGALTRLEQLVLEAGVPSQNALIGEVVDLVVHLVREGDVPAINEVIYVQGWDNSTQTYVVQPLSAESRIGPDGPEE